MEHKLLRYCAAATLLFFFSSSASLAAPSDKFIQDAAAEYASMKASLVKKYEDTYNHGEKLDRQYYLANRKDTIRNQVQAWQEIVTDGYNTLFAFLRSEDFDKAHLIYNDYYFNQSLGMPMMYKKTWPAEIGPAWEAVQRCCKADNSNDCRYEILQKALPHYRDFANKIEGQLGGFFRSVDQRKLGYYDEYYKKNQRFTYTWPKNAEKLLNFFKDKNYDQELQSRRISGSSLKDASLLTVNIRSNEGRLLNIYVNMEVQDYSNPEPWLRAFLEDGAIVEEGGNYLILKRDNRYYRLVNFLKGRKSLAVVYSIESDRTIDAMARYLIFALRDYVASGGGPQPSAPSPITPAARQIELKPLTSANLVTSPQPGNTCTLQLFVSDSKGTPVANAIAVFEKPMLGSLSTMQVATDAKGQALVTYTSPTEEEMAKKGSREISVTVNVQESASGAKDSATLNIRSLTSEMVATVEHSILPAHPDYYNMIRFRFKAANKKDGSPYKARITTYQQWGALVKEIYQQGGTRTYEMGVWPNGDCAFYYHWIGPPSMMKAADEKVTIEIPELGLKKEVTFSVGIDLAIVAAQRKFSGTLFPLFWEPFNVFIVDRFHPDVDLAALLEKFRIKMDLKIEQTSYAPATVNPAQTGFLSALFTRLEGSSLGSLQDAVIWDVGQWEVQETPGKRFVLIQKGKYDDGSPWIEHPSIIFWERGSYQFWVTLAPGAFDADPRTNTALTDLLLIEEFRGMGDEVMQTVFLPSIEFLAGALAGFSNKLPLKFAFCLKGLAGDVHSIQQPQSSTGSAIDAYTNFLGDAWGCCMDTVGASKELPEKVKELFDSHTLAFYVKTLCETMVGDEPARMKGPAAQTKAVAVAQPQKRYESDKVLEIARLAVKGTRKNYLVVLEQKGIKGYTVSLKGGKMLTRSPQKLGMAGSATERVEHGERFVVIPAAKNEKLVVHLNGTRGRGKLSVITADAVTHYSYSPSPRETTVEIDHTGKLTSVRGDAFAP